MDLNVTDNDALIGYSGFVGSTLLRQRSFAHLYRSTNINTIAGKSFGTVVCAAAPAAMWQANKDPVADERNIDELIGYLDSITCNRFVLISTIAVFADATGVNETTSVDRDLATAYGRNRFKLESFVTQKFPLCLILRLPGLVGPDLRKNALYDLLNENNLAMVDSRSRYQFYPMVNLWNDIKVAFANDINLLHLSVEPVTIGEVAASAFEREFDNRLQADPANYDFHSIHASAFGGSGCYIYSKKESLTAIRAYRQSEPCRQKTAA